MKKEKGKVRKRYAIAGVTVGIVALLAAISVVAFFIPNSKYKDAKKLLDKEEYEKAIEAFTNLNGFLKSEGYLAQAYYSLGLNALETGDEKAAADNFKKGHEADKDSDYGLMAGAFLDYYAGIEALGKKDYDKAGELFKSSANAASDFNLINKASAGTAQISETTV